MSLSTSQIADLIEAARDDLGELKWTDLSAELQEYIAMPQILRKEKVKFESGTGIQRTLQLDHSGAARHVGFFEEDQVNTNDVIGKTSVGWCHTTTNYAIEEKEIAMNKGATRILDLVKLRRNDAMMSLAALMEDTFWSVGPAASTDLETPFGVFYYIVKHTTGTSATTGGFNGATASGHSACAGLTDARWRNWTAKWVYATRDDLIDKMQRCYAYTHFRSPLPNPAPSYARGRDRYVLYMNYSTKAALERAAEDRNENIGKDLGFYQDQLVFRGNPMVWVPKLDEDTSNPIVFINWSVLYPVFLADLYLKEEQQKSPRQHTTHVTHVDLTHNLLCVNRRRLGVISQ